MNSLLSGVGTARKGAQRGDDSDANSGDEGGGRGRASYKDILVGGGGLLHAQSRGREGKNKRGEREGSGRDRSRSSERKADKEARAAFNVLRGFGSGQAVDISAIPGADDTTLPLHDNGNGGGDDVREDAGGQEGADGGVEGDEEQVLESEGGAGAQGAGGVEGDDEGGDGRDQEQELGEDEGQGGAKTWRLGKKERRAEERRRQGAAKQLLAAKVAGLHQSKKKLWFLPARCTSSSGMRATSSTCMRPACFRFSRRRA